MNGEAAGMKISEMDYETAETVAKLESQCFSTPWSRGDLINELDNPWAIWLTATEEGRLAGYLGIQYGPDGADIMSIATEPAFRGRGVAKLLLQEMEQRLKALSLQWITLEVRPSNISALALYTSFGFVQVGRRPRYYQKPTEDALLLTKYFKEEPTC